MQNLSEIYRTMKHAPGNMYDLVKTHKNNNNNPARVLYPEVLKVESRIQDTSEMLNFIDYLNKSNISTEDCIIVSFDIVNMFSSINNQPGLEAVKNALEAIQEQFPPTNCIIEALKFCLESN